VQKTALCALHKIVKLLLWRVAEVKGRNPAFKRRSVKLCNPFDKIVQRCLFELEKLKAIVEVETEMEE